MVRVAVVHHNREIGIGRLEEFLVGHDKVDVWAPEATYPVDVEAVVVMGGFMGAYETDLHPWLVDESTWLRLQVESGVPVLGICLGAQLLAHALGGEAFRAPRPEVGVVELHYTEEGRRHPVVSRLGERAFLAHQDTFRLPSDAVLLASTDRYPAAFRIGSAIGIQCHPETPVEEARRWLDFPDFDIPERAGVSRERYISELEEHAQATDHGAREFFAAWFGRLIGSDR
jgi:GMP synthase (glutamine-hydrolysing)